MSLLRLNDLVISMNLECFELANKCADKRVFKYKAKPLLILTHHTDTFGFHSLLLSVNVGIASLFIDIFHIFLISYLSDNCLDKNHGCDYNGKT